MEEEGFTDVDLSEEMMEDLEINENFHKDVLGGMKKVIGKL